MFLDRVWLQSDQQYSGDVDTHIRDVAFLVLKEKANTLLKWEPISDRMIRARFNSKYCKFTAIQCYVPTKEADEEDKDTVKPRFNEPLTKTSI